MTEIWQTLKQAQRMATANFRRLPSPWKISCIITYRCNLRCRMCHIWKKKAPVEDLKPDEIGSFLRGTKGLFWLGIGGGEPFLREDVLEIVLAARAGCPDLSAVHFATNGTLTDEMEMFVRRLRQKDSRLKVIATISLDGPPDLHDWIRGREGVWEKAVASFRMLRKLPGTKAQFGFTLTRDNLDRYEDTLASIRQKVPDLCFDDITVNIFQQSPFFYENQELAAPEAKDIERNINRMISQDRDRISINSIMRRLYLKHYLGYLKTGRPPLRCQAFSASAFLDPSGNLFPCAVFERKLLNIRESATTLSEAWRSAEARQIHQECCRGKCPGCWNPCDAYSSIAGSMIPAIMRK